MSETGISIDDYRESAARRLAERAACGGLTLDEYAERAEAVEQAATADELDAAVRGLPEEAEGEPRHKSWLVGIFGGAEQRGRWRLSSRLRIVAVFGGANLDLGNAEPEAPESVITIVAFLGGAELTAPPGVPVVLSGFSLLGGRADERAGGPPLPGSPVIRVRVFGILGGVKIKGRAGRRNLLDVIRSRRNGADA